MLVVYDDMPGYDEETLRRGEEDVGARLRPGGLANPRRGSVDRTVIAYVDSSMLARALLGDENGSDRARRLLDDRTIAKVTGRWTRIEVSAAVVRAARAGRPVLEADTLARLDAELRPGGRINVVDAPADEVEARALALAREHGLRALDALHVALASIVIPQLADKGEPIGFASRDGDQATVAESLGFAAV